MRITVTLLKRASTLPFAGTYDMKCMIASQLHGACRDVSVNVLSCQQCVMLIDVSGFSERGNTCDIYCFLLSSDQI